MIASKECVEDPLLYEVLGEKPELLQTGDNLEDIINKNFDANRELFWEYLFKPGTTERYLCYVGEDDFFYLQTEYWKSIFIEPCSDFLFLLHNLFIQDLKLKSLCGKTLAGDNGNRALQELKPLNKAEFLELFNDVKASEFLSLVPNSSRSFEYLLADYLNNKKQSNAFNEKLKLASWKVAIEEIKILRNEVMVGVYDYLHYGYHGNQEKVLITKDITSVIDMIKADPNYLWILDEEIEPENHEYVKSCYSPEMFKTFLTHQAQKYPGTIKDEAIQNKIIEILELVFDEKYTELLDLDIQSGFGSLFFSGSENTKVNNLLISYVYDQYRNNELDKLKCFRMKQNDI